MCFPHFCFGFPPFYFISVFHFLAILKVTLSFLSYVFKTCIKNGFLPVFGFSVLSGFL